MIKIKNLVKYVFILLLMLNIGLEKIVDNKGIISNYTNLITMVVALIFFVWSLQSKECQRTLLKYDRKVYKVSLLFFSILLFEVVWTSIHFNLDIVKVLNNSRIYWCLLLVPTILYIFEKFGFERILKIVFVIVLITQILRFLSWGSNNLTSISIFPAMINEYSDEWIRNGYKRMLDTCLLGVELTVAVTLYLNLKIFNKKVGLLIVIMFCLVYASIVTVARSMIIAVCLTVVIMYLLNNNTSKKNIINVCVIAFVILVFLNSGLYNDLITSFGVGSVTYSSTAVRIEALSFYYRSFTSNLWGGLGFSAGLSQEVNYLNFGQISYYYLSDLGFAGTIFKFGICGIFIIFVYIVYGVSAIRNTKYKEYRTLAIGLLSYYILTGLMSNSVFDIQRVFSAPIIMAIFIYIGQQKTERRVRG